MFEGRTYGIMNKSTNIKQETVSKSERSCEFEDQSSYAHNDNNAVKVKNETGIALTANKYVCEDRYDSVKKETYICDCKEVNGKGEPKQEMEEEYYGDHYYFGPVITKQGTDETASYLESVDKKTVSPTCFSQANSVKSLHDDKQATPADILMPLGNDNYGLFNEYITKE